MKILLNKATRFFVLSALAAGLSQMVYAAPVATLENLQGEVFLHSADDAADAWKLINQNTPVNSGDAVKTKNGSCSLVFGEQASFKVEPNTSFIVKDEPESQDIELSIGNLQGKVDKEKVSKPFQVVTSAAVAAIRGTDVDFGFNENGELTVDLHDKGPVQVFNNDAEMSFELEGQKKAKVKYDAENGTLDLCYGVDKIFKHEKDKDGNPLPDANQPAGGCGFTGSIAVKVKDKEYNVNACDCQELDLGEETAAGLNDIPGTNQTNNDNGSTPTPTPTATPTDTPTPTPTPISNTQ